MMTLYLIFKFRIDDFILKVRCALDDNKMDIYIGETYNSIIFYTIQHYKLILFLI